MDSRKILLVSAALNVLLAGALVYLWQRPAAAPPPQVIKETVTNVVVRGVVRPGLSTTNLSGLITNIWRVVESADYRTYIANLRAIGCPEETIRDIIITDINKLYAQKQQAINPYFKSNQYWLAGATAVTPAQAREFQRQLRQLEKEKRDLVRNLLGVDYQSEMARQNPYLQLQDRQLAFLPEAKRARIRQIQEKYNDLREDFALQHEGPLTAEQRTQLETWQTQQEQEIRALLTPDELREYDLRVSPVGLELQTRMTAFSGASEENYRQVFAIEQRYQEQLKTLQAAGALTPEARQNLERQREIELKNALGERYQEYERTRDPAYREIYQAFQQLKLPTQTASTVHDLKQAAEEQYRQLVTHPGLTAEQMAAGAQALRAEVERTMREVMGETAYQEYLRRGGYWVERLSAVPVNSNPPAPPTVPQ
ncbi:MAG: hypothetical protein N3J91_15590 [Verrucomicrobiae bacterium]|nr:hypothetical protein [Verrucomicrobiae bacterium]